MDARWLQDGGYELVDRAGHKRQLLLPSGDPVPVRPGEHEYNREHVTATERFVTDDGGRRVQRVRRADGVILQEAALPLSKPEWAQIVGLHPDGQSLLVLSMKVNEAALLELSMTDLSILRSTRIDAKPDERHADISSLEAFASSSDVYVASVARRGARLRHYRRSDLGFVRELFFPLRYADEIGEMDDVRLWGSPGAAWLAVQRDAGGFERLIVVDTGRWRIAEDLEAHDADVQFSQDGAVMSVLTGCMCEGEDHRVLRFLSLGRGEPVLQLRLEDHNLIEMRPGFVWAVGADWKRAKRWDFGAFQAPRVYSLSNVIVKRHSSIEAVNDPSQTDPELVEYPLQIDIEPSGDLLVAEYDGAQVTVHRVREQGAELVLRRAVRGLLVMHLAAAEQTLALVTTEGGISRDDLRAPAPMYP